VKQPSKKKAKKAEDGGEQAAAGGPSDSRRGNKVPGGGGGGGGGTGQQPRVPEGPSRKAALGGGDKATPPPLDLNGAKALPANLKSADQQTIGGIPPTPGTGTGEGLDPVQKKIRNLNKKLKAIDELKEKVKKGDKMEATQLKKIEGEADIKKDLAAMMAELSMSAGVEGKLLPPTPT